MNRRQMILLVIVLDLLCWVALLKFIYWLVRG